MCGFAPLRVPACAALSLLLGAAGCGEPRGRTLVLYQDDPGEPADAELGGSPDDPGGFDIVLVEEWPGGDFPPDEGGWEEDPGGMGPPDEGGWPEDWGAGDPSDDGGDYEDDFDDYADDWY